MAKTFYYQREHQMTARHGVQYATRYYQQSLEQRQQLTRHIRDSAKELLDYLDQHPREMQWHRETPLKGFPKTKGQPNRTTWEIITDMIGEARGRKKNGLPKDYAAAPIDRWNKLFHGTDYEFRMEQRDGVKKNTFEDLWKMEEQ